MKLAKIFAITLSIYVLIVIVFESLLGYYQPGAQQSLVITTTNEDGTVNSRVVLWKTMVNCMCLLTIGPEIGITTC